MGPNFRDKAGCAIAGIDCDVSRRHTPSLILISFQFLDAPSSRRQGWSNPLISNAALVEPPARARGASTTSLVLRRRLLVLILCSARNRVFVGLFVSVLEGLTPNLGLIQTPFRRHPMKDITIRRRLVEPLRSPNATYDLFCLGIDFRAKPGYARARECWNMRIYVTLTNM